MTGDEAEPRMTRIRERTLSRTRLGASAETIFFTKGRKGLEEALRKTADQVSPK